MSHRPPNPSAFATPAQPIAAASAIHTDDLGLVTGWATIHASDAQRLPLYFARPETLGPYPVALVVHEIFGLPEYIRDVVRRLAKAGYFALAPSLHFRHGDPTAISRVERLRSEILPKLSDAQVLADLDSSFDWAVSQGGDDRRLGLSGFGWGGRIAWLHAAHQPRLKAAVAWYGELAGECGPLTPRQPMDVLAELRAPVLGLYGGRDSSIAPATLALAQEKLADLGSPSRIEIYPQAGHAFHADYRPSYRAEDAADAWRRMLQWFGVHGLAAEPVA